MTDSPITLVDADGTTELHVPGTPRKRVSQKALLSWTGASILTVLVTVIVTMQLQIHGLQSDVAVLQVTEDPTVLATVRTNTKEIERLRMANDNVGVWQQKIAETMATREDVNRLSAELRALAIEIRGRR